MAYIEASERSRLSVAAARAVMARDGVAATTVRAVAAEAGVPLGTLQYVFPTKELLLKAVIEDVVDEIAALLAASLPTEGGLARAIREGMEAFWATLVTDQVQLQIMQGELLNYSLRKTGHEHLAQWQYDRYRTVLADWCERAATAAGETTAIPFDRLARVLLAGVDGLILQYVCEPDDQRAGEDLALVVAMVVDAARIEPGR
ncbi:TetR/AcrR family transcriptional regulator [Nocardioides marmoriginsengisoli]|uniref:TetR/AcrR family transcriptional regulator n=1 Tax=Nocardioides marmoriginsengisoli TaxID=661483 RepID=A0A3N0CI36_9ACTN|nr:TetR/AcrR family transcriptional regulator [Nocardioides marmoriginsengisoli]RNL63102.1 TetR/AcrR family transcriptional regulator [Nocardioides marmoriginsengisoli]